jgi:hypothetical protein
MSDKFVSTENNDNENALETSYRGSYRVAEAVKTHFTAEIVSGPSTEDVASCPFRRKCCNKYY